MDIIYTEYKNTANFNKTKGQNFKNLISQLTKIGPNVIKVTEMEYILNAIKVGIGQSNLNNFVRKGQAFLTYYEDFFDVGNFSQAKSFSQPQNYAYDPTFIGQFSNVIGKIHTNIMFKRLSGGILTFNYEGWARLNGVSLKGTRPDLVGLDTNKQFFSLESKGWKVDKGDQNKFKAVQQASSVNIGQVSSIAVVSSNLFSKIKIDYIDPPVDGVPRGISLEGLVTKYYEIWKLQLLKCYPREIFEPYPSEIFKPYPSEIFEPYPSEIFERYRRKILRRYHSEIIDGIKFIIFDYIVFCNEFYLLGIDKRHLKTYKDNKVEFYKYEQREGDSYIDPDGIGVFRVLGRKREMILEDLLFLFKEKK